MTVNLVITEVSASGKDLFLSTWNANHNGLVTKVKDSTGTAIPDTNFTDGSDGILYRAYRVSIWLSHGTFTGNMSETEWHSLIDAKTVTYAFAYKNSATSGQTEIGADYLPFYFVESDAGSAPAISYSLETAADPVKGFTSGAFSGISVTEGTPTQIGYLFVRAEGEGTDHVTGTNYVGQVEGTGTVS